MPLPIRWRRPAASTSPRMSISRRSGAAAESMGAAVHGPIDQSEFLLRLGIETRADALKARGDCRSRRRRSTPPLARLTRAGRTGMGALVQGDRARRSEARARCRRFDSGRDRMTYDHGNAAALLRSARCAASAMRSSRARAACRTASMRASMAASARRMMPQQVAENRARMARALGVAPEQFRDAPIKSIRPTSSWRRRRGTRQRARKRTRS